MAAVRRKSALLAAVSLVLAALGLEAYAAGYPMGMSLLAAATLQALICSAMFRSRLLVAVVVANLVLFVAHAVVISRFLAQPYPPAVFQLGDFCCAVLAAASLVFTPIETMALVVREAYLKRPRRRPPR
ncbi:hypothetical protein QTH90_21740 [Variovorax sp. J2P1-59]|uniref:hypothetical protein n=1 Tax=Variovorax flavidus TaxID=3053501 RepID=UPI002574F3AA|nr:hypothetical protein [Variovorax sp. J2P1-59]MDM0077048.1 hypothetical protein [Variovorax sp. J2P1-59]